MTDSCRTRSVPGEAAGDSQGILRARDADGILLILFRGVADNLIPLFAIGAFLAFTLSQAGMVGHWAQKSRAGRGTQHVH